MINDIDTGLINLIKIIVFGWSFFFAFLSAKYLIFKQYQSIYILIIFHCFFLGLPLLLDLVVGQPAYDRFPSIKIAINDETTFWIYCLYVSIVPVIWWYTGRSRKTKQSVSLLIDRNRMSFPLSLNFSQINTYRLGKNFKLLVKLLCYLLLF